MNVEKDFLTFDLIQKSVKESHPDLIVITGDITMVPDGEHRLIELRILLDSLEVYWTFVFGNHDYESNLSLLQQAELLKEGSFCIFENGNPDLRGVGNYYFELRNKEKLIALLGFFDSHNNRTDLLNGESVWSYDYIDPEQIHDAVSVVTALKEKNTSFSSLFFFHIPILDFKLEMESNRSGLNGECNEEVSCSKYDFGLFKELSKTKTLKGIFVGHDHVNDYSFEKEGCLLAFGRCTGHYNYTMPEFIKGARVIDISASGLISSYVIKES